MGLGRVFATAAGVTLGFASLHPCLPWTPLAGLSPDTNDKKLGGPLA